MTTATRDLSFAPIENSHPESLSIAQIERYNSEGFIRPLPVFEADEARKNREYFNWLLEQVSRANDGRDHYSINGYHVHCARLWDIVTDTRILDYVEDMLGPNYVCWGSHFFAKLPHDPKAVPFHQDASYWPLEPALTVTVWLAIDNADEENAAMMFIPGTHRRGHLQWKTTAGSAVLDQEIENVESLGEPVYDELQAGQISLHADMLAHGSRPNSSDRRRCGLTIRYCPMSVRAAEGWNRDSIWCRGEDASGHWADNRRPEGEAVDDKSWPKEAAALAG